MTGVQTCALPISSASSIDREPQYKPDNVPVLSLSEIVNKARGNIIFTSSDMSKEGSVTLPNGESIESVQLKYSTGEGPVTITSIQNPHEMLGNDNAVKYVVSGIETLFANKWLSDKELHDHIMGVITSKKASNDLNISEKHWKEIISQLDKIKTHKELGDWLTKASFPVRKIITSSLLEGLNKDTFVNDNARKEFVIGRISGNNTQKGELPPGAIAGLMEYAGKNGRGFSQKDFFESTSKEEYYNAWLKHGINKGEFGLLVGGFISLPEKKPFMLDKYYSLNNPGTMDVKYQKASKEDEVRIKEIADQYSELPPQYVAGLLSRKSGIPESKIMEIISGAQKPDPDTQVIKERKSAINADVPKEVVDKESDELRKYVQKSQDLSDAEAEMIIKKYGEQRAEAFVMYPPKWLEGDTRVFLASKVLKSKSDAMEAAKTEDVKDKILDDMNAMRLNLYEDFTRDGRTLAAARILKLETPESLARNVDKKIKDLTKDSKDPQGLTPEEKQKIKELKKKQMKAHSGSPKTKATQTLTNYISKVMFGHAKTTKKASKIIESIWYANILSGVSTQNRNTYANFTQWIGEMTVQSVKSMAQGDFITPIKMLGGSLRGLKRGLTAAVYTQMTGTRLARLDKTEMLPVFEWWRYDTDRKSVV